MTAVEPPIKLLLVEDERDLAEVMKKSLTESAIPAFQVELAESLNGCLERLAAGGVDVLLLDLNLPDSKGLETFLRVVDKAPQVPTVILTAHDDAAMAIDAVRRGAQEYLVKGEAEIKLLSRIIRYAVERKRAEECLKQKTALEGMNRFMLGREERIIELKREINQLLSELGREEKYTL